MANIPGITGYTQPGVFSRDIVRSSATSATGSGRTAIIMGEAINSELIVSSASGGGLDGDASANPAGTGALGRFFKCSGAPLVSGRTEIIYTKASDGTEYNLYGKQESLSSGDLDQKYDFRIDHETGAFELQKPSIKDSGGKLYTAKNGTGPMLGNGVLVTGDYTTFKSLQILDDTISDGSKIVIKVSPGTGGTASPMFEVVYYDSAGSPTSTSGIPYSYIEDTNGAVSGNASASDGFPVIKSTDVDYDTSTAYGTAVPEWTSLTGDVDTVKITGHNVEARYALPGDYLCLEGYDPQEIDTISYDGADTTIVVKNAVYSSAIPAEWEIKAIDLFVAGYEYLAGDNFNDGSAGSDNEVDGYVDGGPFDSSYEGAVIAITSGKAKGLYTITKFMASRMVRVEKFQDSSSGFPSAEVDTNGFAEINLSYHILQQTPQILFGVKNGSAFFEDGDKFTINIKSWVLGAGDKLEARYISAANINKVEDFDDAGVVSSTFGEPSLENTLSLGCSLALGNGAPLVRTIHCKPPSRRKTVVTLVEEQNSLGEGGITACGGNADNCERDDLVFQIPRPISGLRNGKPDSDTAINIFAIRNGRQIQLPLNKTGFYNTQLESEVEQTKFITSSDYNKGYTVVNTEVEVLGSANNGTLLTDSSPGTLAYFQTTLFNFDSIHATSETTIVITSLEVSGASSNTLITKESEIAEKLFGSGNSAAGVELVIKSIISDTTVEVSSKKLNSSDLNYDFEKNLDLVDIQFFVKDATDTSNASAALVLNKSLISSGLLQSGDGLRISYIDQSDADFYDYAWSEAFEKLEAIEGQIVVPLPTSQKSMIFGKSVTHCNLMSNTANKKERVAFFGAIRGVTYEALIGNENVAVENIGVIEGIQGDDVEEVLAKETEDLVNYKLNENYTAPRACYFWPDELKWNNGIIDGYYAAAAAAGWFTSQGNLALPLTNKSLTDFAIDAKYSLSNSKLNNLGAVGATVLQPFGQNALVLASRTTSTTGFIEDEEPSIIFIRDEVKTILRNLVRGYVGTAQDQNTLIDISVRVETLMNGLISRGIITSFRNLKVSQDKVDPRQINVFVGYTPSYPVNYVYVEIEVGVQ